MFLTHVLLLKYLNFLLRLTRSLSHMVTATDFKARTLVILPETHNISHHTAIPTLADSIHHFYLSLNPPSPFTVPNFAKHDVEAEEGAGLKV